MRHVDSIAVHRRARLHRARMMGRMILRAAQALRGLRVRLCVERRRWATIG